MKPDFSICQNGKWQTGISVILFYQKLAILVLECCYQLYANATGFHSNGLHLPHTFQKQFLEILFSSPQVQHRIIYFVLPIGTFIFFGF